MGFVTYGLGADIISPSMPYREARSVAESSEAPTASKSDRTGRNPGMTRLVRRSSATSGGTAFFSLVEKSRKRMRKSSGSPLLSIPKTDAILYKESWTFQLIPQASACLVFSGQR